MMPDSTSNSTMFGDDACKSVESIRVRENLAYSLETTRQEGGDITL
jgi:hypothetical protein